MASTEDRIRIVIAVTDPSEVGGLWQTAMQRLGEKPSELLALFLSDDRWVRAASLPFTREISRIGGVAVDFTPARAERLSRDIVRSVERSIARLAGEARLPFMFRVLSDAQSQEFVDLVGKGNTLLIASSRLAHQPLYTYIEKADWRIELIDLPEPQPDAP
jgi:hypothetical protein